MAEKLKSALRQIPWSLLLKAGIAGGGWLYFPFPVFVLVCLAVYSKPAFNFSKFLHFFLAFLFFAFITAHSVVNTILLSLTFYLLLGIKDLVFIERSDVFEMILLLFSYLGLVSLFGVSSGGSAFDFFPSAVLYSTIVFVFIESFLSYERKLDSKNTIFPALIFSFLFLEFLFVIKLLPLTRASSVVLMLNFVILGIEFLRGYEESMVKKNTILLQGGFAVLVLIPLVLWTSWGF